VRSRHVREWTLFLCSLCAKVSSHNFLESKSSPIFWSTITNYVNNESCVWEFLEQLMPTAVPLDPTKSYSNLHDTSLHSNSNWLTSFSGAFAKLRKATISFVMSVRPSAWNNSVPTDRFLWNLIFEFSKICPENSSFIKIRQGNGCFTRRRLHINDSISQNSS
jgi:hypothetical protein